MKKLVSVVLCLLMIAGIVTIGKPAAAETQGKVFNIYAWNEEFKGFFEKYYTVPEGVLNISIFSFKSCHTLKYLTIPESVETIDPGVFDENTEITLRVKKHSPAYKYALEYNINFELV